MENLENQWCKAQNQLHTQPTHAARCKELNPGHGKDKWVLSAIPALCDVRVKFSKKLLPVRLNHWPGVKPSNYQARCDNNN